MSSLMQSLPFEILLEVFLHLTRIVHEDFLSSLDQNQDKILEQQCRPYSWLHVTHVCRFWRVATLSYPSLWTNIIILTGDMQSNFGPSDEYLETMLSRSVEMPLSITCPYRILGTETAAHWHRIHSLTLTPQSCSSWYPLQDEIFDGLRSLRVMGKLSTGYCNLWYLYITSFPALEHLDIQVNVTAPSPVSLFCGKIKYIAIRTMWLTSRTDGTGYYNAMDVSDLLDVLSNLPVLETLSINISGKGYSSSHSPLRTPPVEVHSLQRLDIVGTAQAFIDLWEHLVVRPDLRVSLQLLDVDISAATVGREGDHLAALRAEFPIFQLEHLHITSLDSLNLSGLNYLRHAVSSPSLKQLVIERSVGAVVLAIMESANCEHLTLREIEFRPRDEDAGALWDFDRSSCMPRCHSLFQRQADLYLQVRHALRAAGVPMVANSFNALAQFLAPLKRPLRTLTLTSCWNLKAADIETLRGIVSNIAWDNAELETGSELGGLIVFCVRAWMELMILQRATTHCRSCSAIQCCEGSTPT